MKIIHLSYAQVNDYHDPHLWLKKISFFVGILETMSRHTLIRSIHCISYSGIIEKNNVEYHFLKQKKWQRWLPFSLHRYIKNLEPDVVIVHGLIFPVQVLMLHWQLGKGIKIMAQHHAERPLKGVRKYTQRYADRYIRAYMFCSLDLGKQWVDHRLIRHKEKIKEVMEVSSPFNPMPKELAKSFSKISGNIIFLWVGGLHARKDPLLAAKAFIQFQKANEGVQLYMIYQSNEMLVELRSLIMKSQASDFIHLGGKVDHPEISYWYSSADFIISTSHYEGSGIAVCEAMSCGCIPVLSNLPSFRMMTNNGNVGVLFESGDEQGLVNALQHVLHLNQEVEKQRVLEQFRSKLSFDAIAEEMLEVIREN